MHGLEPGCKRRTDALNPALDPRVALLAAVFWASACLLAGRAWGQTNVGLSARAAVANGQYVVMAVRERDERGSVQCDLNGDGDCGDTVLHVRDTNSTTTRVPTAADGSPLAIWGFTTAGDYVAMLVRERRSGLDFNGDGDARDPTVIFLYDLSSFGTTAMNTGGVGAAPRRFEMNSSLLVTSSRERRAAADLNGDGDLRDEVLQVFGLTAGTTLTQSPRLAVKNLAFADSHVCLSVPERSQGSSDLNGDGDVSDAVVHACTVSGTTLDCVNVERAVGSLKTSDGGCMFEVLERKQEQDLNLDGDESDELIQVYDFGRAASCSPLPDCAVHEVNLPARPKNWAVGDKMVAFTVGEGKLGGDRNGDGDSTDNVLAIVGLEAGSALAGLTTGSAVIVGASARRPEIVGDYVVFVGDEVADQVDLNGDGDQVDRVLRVADPSTSPVSVLTLGQVSLRRRVRPFVKKGAFSEDTEANRFFDSDGTVVVFLVNETNNGSGDLNGDGDADDNIVQYYDLTSGTGVPISTDLSGSFYEIANGLIAIATRERFEGASDLNGDGDSNDATLHLYDIASATLKSFPVAVAQNSLTVGAGFAAYLTKEHKQQCQLNGDLDSRDRVVGFTKFTDTPASPCPP